MEDFNKKQEERLNRFCNAYSLYLLVTNYHGVRLSELMVGVLNNSIPTSPSILNAKLHIKMGLIATTTAIPKRIRKFVYKEGCDTNERTNIAINSKDAEGMHPSVFPEDSAYCPNDQNGEPKITHTNFYEVRSYPKTLHFRISCCVQLTYSITK